MIWRATVIADLRLSTHRRWHPDSPLLPETLIRNGIQQAGRIPRDGTSVAHHGPHGGGRSRLPGAGRNMS
jgi:hypothetical protein